MFFFPSFGTKTAEINDMKICYVLLDRSNATSDIFYFTVEDNGKNPVFLYMSSDNKKMTMTENCRCLSHFERQTV